MLARAVIGLCLTVAACSSGTGPGPQTILFTNPLGVDYNALALDRTTPWGLDTILVVPVGAQVCLSLSAAHLQRSDVVELLAIDNFGSLLGTTMILPGVQSWTWDGAAHAAVAPNC